MITPRSYGDVRGGTITQRAGGYGGLGGSSYAETPSTDAARAELFGSRPTQTYQQQPQSSQRRGIGSGLGTQASLSYGSYGDRQLTAEEEEEQVRHTLLVFYYHQDVKATTSEVRMLKQSDVASTENALRLAQQAAETGRQTLSRLGEQGERIHRGAQS
ncbi:hypothetical protein BDV96DRAFT_647648 [Lophiotrema nucula]|uniref:Uncharacterized protein n=1 Tax=Lophiotrema nucula TaxID=690887 RepID=A0A6A5Z434_9PLEO|nr:hypothetical protein BDV96DRAFT_647648 [Lophiotrema nucula]